MTNLLTNPSFETGAIAPWVAVGPSAANAIMGVASGEYRLDWQIAQSADRYADHIKQTFTVPVAGTYRIMLKMYVASGTKEVDVSTTTGHGTYFTLTTSSETYHTVDLALPAGTSTLYIHVGSTSGNYRFYLDAALVELYAPPAGTNLIANGQFSTPGVLEPWRYNGVGIGLAVANGYFKVHTGIGDNIEQDFTTGPAAVYRLTLRAWSSWNKTIDGPKILPELSVPSLALTAVPAVFTFDVTLAANQARQLRMIIGPIQNHTFYLDDVYLTAITPTAVSAVAVAPSTVDEPIEVTVIGLLPGQAVTVARVADNEEKLLPGTATANGVGTARADDWGYPFGSTVYYRVYNSDMELWATSNTITAPDALVPWLRDAFLPELLATPTAIVDITSRVRASRVTVYRVVAQKLPVTLGDIRQSSDGTMTLLCRDHAERDRVIGTLSSGYPVTLRVPADCRAVIDDMVFTPLDITETRFGTSGACLLDVDFVESSAEAVSQYVPASYALQTINADAASLTYAGLSQNFAGRNYAALYVSGDGVSP